MAASSITTAEVGILNGSSVESQAVGLGSKIQYLFQQLGTADTNGIVFSGAMDNGRAVDFSGVTVSTNTDGSCLSTGSTWLVHATAGQCAVKFLCASSATTGDYATLRIRARADGASATAGVVGGNFAASANVDEYANLYAVQGYAQPLAKAQTQAANIVSGVYSCVQRTVESSGRSWSLWTDTHETALASASHYLHRLSHNGGAINLHGIWTIYSGQGCDVLMNFETADTVAPLSACTGTTPAADGIKIAIKTNAGTYYLRAASAWT